MKLGSQDVSPGARPYIIAELGANHNGSVELARKMIVAAKEAGADCVKFQSWTKDSIFARQVYRDNYFLNDDYRNRTDHTLESIVEAYSLNEAQFRELKTFCTKIDIEFGCTPFSKREVDFLVDELDMKFIKVASMDLNNFEFLKHLASKRRPIVLSTGLSQLWEIDLAVQTLEDAGCRDIVILHCVSVYPPRDEAINLRNMDLLRTAFPDHPVGFSDHTLGTAVPIAAVALGACLIEKHFTLDKTMEGWDHKISATPDELAAIVSGARKVHLALGTTRRSLTIDDRNKIPAFRRSVVAARAITRGQTITAEDLVMKRPGTGIEPRHFGFIVGRKATRDIEADELLREGDF